MKLDPSLTSSSLDDVLTKLELTIKRVHQEDDRRDQQHVQREAALQRVHGATLSSVLAQKSRNQQHYKSPRHRDEERRDDEEDSAREPESVVVKLQTMIKQAENSSIHESKSEQHFKDFLGQKDERRHEEDHRERYKTQLQVQRVPPRVPSEKCAEIQNAKHDVKMPIASAKLPSPLRPSNLNDIIWKAYAKTKSLGKVVSGIVVAQAAARRWIAVKHYNRLRIEKREREQGAIKIAAAWRKSQCQLTYRSMLKGV